MEISINEEKSLIVIKKQVENVEGIGRIRITSQVKLEQAVEARKRVLEAKKLVETQKKEITDPLNLSLKKIRNLFKPFEQRLDIVDSWLKEQMLSWEQAQEEARKEKEKEIEDKIAKGEMTFEQAGKKIEKIDKKIEVVPTREISKVEITDKSKLPLEYLLPDLVLIKRDLLLGKEIEGAKLVKERVVYNKA